MGQNAIFLLIKCTYVSCLNWKLIRPISSYNYYLHLSLQYDPWQNKFLLRHFNRFNTLHPSHKLAVANLYKSRGSLDLLTFPTYQHQLHEKSALSFVFPSYHIHIAFIGIASQSKHSSSEQKWYFKQILAYRVMILSIYCHMLRIPLGLVQKS